jgi:hypothetical protein
VRLNVLVIHRIDPASVFRKTSVDHAYCFARYAAGHNYLYHNIDHPVTTALRELRFHAVILDTTALCIRYFRPRALFDQEKVRWALVGQTDAVKVAFPQDDYDHSGLLDDWMADWRVDTIYSVLPQHRKLLYPRSISCSEILPALTGYVNDADLVRFASFAKPFPSRNRDVGYRAKHLPPEFGNYGLLKGRISDALNAAREQHRLVIDSSTRPEDVFFGDDWLQFLGDCRFCPGSEGGSSLHDPHGEIRDRVVAFLRDEPQATFEEVEAACFPGLDGRVVFSAVSPRLFETAALKCGQILVEAPYLGVLKPGEHYIPLRPDLSDLDAALEETRNHGKAMRQIDATFEALVVGREFRYSTHAERVIAGIRQRVARNHVQGSSQQVFDRLARRHGAELEQLARRPSAATPSGTTRFGLRAAVRRMVPQPVRAMLRQILRQLRA